MKPIVQIQLCGQAALDAPMIAELQKKYPTTPRGDIESQSYLYRLVRLSSPLLLCDGLLLLVSAATSLDEDSRRELARLAPHAKELPLIVYLSGCEGYEPDVLDLVEQEIRGALSEEGYAPDDASFIRSQIEELCERLETRLWPRISQYSDDLSLLAGMLATTFGDPEGLTRLLRERFVEPVPQHVYAMITSLLKDDRRLYRAFDWSFLQKMAERLPELPLFFGTRGQSTFFAIEGSAPSPSCFLIHIK